MLTFPNHQELGPQTKKAQELLFKIRGPMDKVEQLIYTPKHALSDGRIRQVLINIFFHIAMVQNLSLIHI